MPKIVIAHLGARKHYQEPVLFHKWGILERFYTDYYARDSVINEFLRSNRIYRHLPKMVKKMLGRYTMELRGAHIVDFPILGIYDAIARQCNSVIPFKLAAHTNNIYRAFCQRIISKGLGKASVVYGISGASLELFQYAKQRGLKIILDQVLAERSLVNRLLLEEENIWKYWSVRPFELSDACADLEKRESDEQDLADYIVCGSEFVKDTLTNRGVLESKIRVVSLGRTEGQIKHSQYAHKKIEPKASLNILFSGSVGLRKGVPYLLEALKILKGQIPFNCKLAGDISIRAEKLRSYQHLCEFSGRVTRSEMEQLYRWADVFVLPSICEGSAMVVYEALHYGLPVVTTHNSGSIVRDGIDGLIVPMRSSRAIADALIKVFENPAKFNDAEGRCLYLMESSKRALDDFKSIFV